jgi:hypothetical protein
MDDNVVVFPDKSGGGGKLGISGGGPGRPVSLVAALRYLAQEAETAGFAMAAHLIVTAIQAVRDEAADLTAAADRPSDSDGSPSRE